jgi:hypothetical protein
METGMIPRKPRRPATAVGATTPSYTGRVARRIRFRPPGLKPTTKIGTLGPYRGRLGLGWVVAPMVVGVVLLIAVGIYFLAR